MSKFPLVSLRRGEERRLRSGHPWAFSNEIDMTSPTKALEPGSVVALATAGGERLGLATFNPHSLIGARLLSRDIDAPIDAAFFAARFARAQALRERLIGRPYYRLAHAEADGLPGLIVDRFGDIFAVQANTAGMDRLLPQIVEALQSTFAPQAIVLKNDSPVRALEGLGQGVELAHGRTDEPSIRVSLIAQQSPNSDKSTLSSHRVDGLPEAVDKALHQALGGQVSQTIYRPNYYQARLTIGASAETTLDTLRKLPVKTLNGEAARLEEIAEIDLQSALAEGVAVEEYGAHFFADLVGGQKTGWFYDQRDNRHLVGRLAKDARVLDVYCYAGGFAVQAALGGAREVLAVDRSEGALALAQRSAAANGIEGRLRTHKAEAFEALEAMIAAREQFEVVIVDPPAFVKSRKDIKAGTQGYRKLARLAGQLVSPGGLLFIASCSHLMEPPLFADTVRHGLADLRRGGRVLYSLGAAPDHPVHPALPESAYLKAQLLQLD